MPNSIRFAAFLISVETLHELVDPLFGKMPEKKIIVYLVLPENEENHALITEFKHIFKAPDIDYVMFVNPKTHKHLVKAKEQF